MQLLQTTLAPQYGEWHATLASIIGVPGVGKSALANRFAHSVRDQYPDSQLYSDLQPNVQPLEPAEPTQVLRRFLLALGHKPNELPQSEEELADEFQEATEGKRIIILLDNAASYEQVRPLIPKSPTCHVIVTSRARFAKLAVSPLVLRPLPPESAEELFYHIAPHRRPSTDEEAGQLREVIRRICDGLPIAIRVLGARMASRPSYTFDWILGELNRSRGLTSAFGAGREEIKECFGLSYRGLDTNQATLFRRLGAVPGESFERSLAAQLVGVDPSEATVLLEQLNDLQLLEPTADPNYFTMHSLLRQFAIEQLAEDHDQRSRLQVFETILTFYLSRASAADRTLQSEFGATHFRDDDPGEQQELVSQDLALAWFKAEHLNLVAAIKQACIDGYWELAWRLCTSLVGFFEIRSEWESWRDTHESVIAILNAQEQSVARAHILRGLGRHARALRRWNEAIDHYREAAALFYQHGLLKDAGTTLHALGDVCRYQRSWDSAANCLEEARRILQEVGYVRGVAIAKRSLGTVPRVRGDFDAAIQLYREALEILEREGDERWAAATKLSLADIYLDRQHPNAQHLLESCLTVFERFGDRYWRALTLRSLGEALRLDGQREQALRRLSDSLDLIRPLGDRLWEAQVLHSIGLVHLDDGDACEALRYFDEALEWFKADGDTLWVGRTYISIGRANRLITGEDAGRRALDAFCRAWPLLVEQGAKADLAKLRKLLSEESERQVTPD